MHAMTALQVDGDLAVAMVVGQVRSAVLDLLRCSGMELADAQQALDEAAGRICGSGISSGIVR